MIPNYLLTIHGAELPCENLAPVWNAFSWNNPRYTTETLHGVDRHGSVWVAVYDLNTDRYLNGFILNTKLAAERART